MKFSLYYTFASFLASALIACNASAPLSSAKIDTLFKSAKISNAILKFDQTKIDFGDVKKDTLLTGVFKFRNIGSDTLVINNIQPDCSCTSYHLTKKKIAPLDTASISLNVATHDKQGKISLYSTVSANTETKLYSLRLLATVR